MFPKIERVPVNAGEDEEMGPVGESLDSLALMTVGWSLKLLRIRSLRTGRKRIRSKIWEYGRGQDIT
jgi:hypothetical protein